MSPARAAQSLHTTNRFRFSVSLLQRTESARSGRGSEAEDPAGFRQARHHWRGRAYVSPHRGDDAGRDGRTPTHHPRLPASQQSFHVTQQVPAGNTQQQALGPRQTCRRHIACRSAAGETINPHPVRAAARVASCRKMRMGRLCTLVSPDQVWPRFVSC